jgi:hypothetical protein
MYGQKRNITYIEDLPELEDLELGGSHNKNNMIPQKYQKFIRPSGALPPPPQSGMGTNQAQSSYHTMSPPPHHGHHMPTPQQHIPHLKRNMISPEMSHSHNRDFREGFSNNQPTCLEIAKHIENCPICSKFYKRDNSLYIIAIIILSIICILLLKKVLNL